MSHANRHSSSKKRRNSTNTNTNTGSTNTIIATTLPCCPMLITTTTLILLLLALAACCPTVALAQRLERQRSTTAAAAAAAAAPLSFIDFHAINSKHNPYQHHHHRNLNDSNDMHDDGAAAVDDHHDELIYAFNYHIDHAPTMVHLSHEEARHGTHVSGQYGLLEPNGAVRSVRYEVDGAGGGFHVVVQTRTAASRMLQRLQLRNRQQPVAPLQQAVPVALLRR